MGCSGQSAEQTFEPPLDMALQQEHHHIRGDQNFDCGDFHWSHILTRHGLSPMKTVFLDYDTVSNGDLDSRAGCARLAGDLTLYDIDESQIAERIGDAEVVLLNKLELIARTACSARPRLKLIALAAHRHQQHRS